MQSGRSGVASRARPFQIVATLGPSSWQSPRELIDAGATALRINGSHATLQQIQDALHLLRRMASAVPVIIDLQGAKMRLGQFASRPLRQGEPVVFALDPASPGEVPLPHQELFEQIAPGVTLRIDDDRLRLRVTDVRPGAAAARALTDGMLHPRKGVNLVEHPVRLSGLTSQDRILCALAADSSRVACAVSFMTDGHEAIWVREVAPGCPVVGKVEHREALEHLEAIDAAVDEVWVCRGDLGAQVGVATLARWMGQFDPLRLQRPVLVAGQVLEHLTAHAVPTRSEVCHLYDLRARGYVGVVLSDETAVGVDPVRAVRTARGLIEAFQQQ